MAGTPKRARAFMGPECTMATGVIPTRAVLAIQGTPMIACAPFPSGPARMLRTQGPQLVHKHKGHYHLSNTSTGKRACLGVTIIPAGVPLLRHVRCLSS